MINVVILKNENTLSAEFAVVRVGCTPISQRDTKASSTKFFVQIRRLAHIENGCFVFCKGSPLFLHWLHFASMGVVEVVETLS